MSSCWEVEAESASSWRARAPVDDFGNEVGPGWPEVRFGATTSGPETRVQQSNHEQERGDNHG